MSRTTPQKKRDRRPRSIKADPDSRPMPTEVGNGPAQNGGHDSDDDENDGNSTQPVGQPSTARLGRSDAPPPSEPVTETTEPIFQQVRRVPPPAPTSPTNVDESFFHDSFQDIGKKLKECNDTLGELQQLGVSHDVQLPELVLVGDQSAGKSSLMSGLANLDLPRSEGTCTRCPLHIRVSRNNDWSCRVWLRKEYSYQPPEDGSIGEEDVTDEDPFFPWIKMRTTTIVEFKTMHDKNEIEDVLRWAQIAILNDGKPHGLFVPGSGSVAMNMTIDKATEETTAKFSPNVVALEIKGPDLPDLSFYDMPGIFQNPADARDDYLVNVVRNLSRAYITHPSAIILCSMPMNTDAENSSTFGLIRRLGATPRTIGVLTKADLLSEIGHAQWLEIMKGQTHQTGFGYFITSRPQGKSLEDLKKWEECVFQDQAFDRWPDSFKEFSHRCGVEKLKVFLSERLGEEFAKSLPYIKSKVKKHLRDIENKLSKLPELPQNVELEIQTALLNFGDSARAKLDEFIRHFGPLPSNFRTCLIEIKPKFILKDRSDIPVLEISDDESDAASAVQQTPSKRPAPTQMVTPSKRRGETAIVNGSFTNGHIKPEEAGTPTNGTPTVPRRTAIPAPFDKYERIGRGFRTIRRVREEIQEKTKAGMPGLISDEVYDDLVKEAIKPWHFPTKLFLDETMKDLKSKLDKTLGLALEGLKKRTVFAEAKKAVHQFLDENKDITDRELSQLCADESERLMTFNEEAFKQYREDELISLTRFRHKMRMEANGFPTRKLLEWADMTEEKRIQDSKRRDAELLKLGPDDFAREIEVVAYIRGYYRLAASRFADAVSQRILCRMVPEIRRKLPSYLDDKLGLRGPCSHSVYERLMEEDEQTANMRETLKGEREKFGKALASIELLESGAARAAHDVELMDLEDSTQPMSQGVDVDAHEGEA
ncbi:dynamin family protein [Purpureocillium lavendulum]|uniref:Dynamin family protein n=1 Tax=Purpureocillium lavendulum TaxID=1247861 RepID=A0AB34FIE3_9HYPO|nr:dynamin family protein [Purpureocillium lavendulum]